MHVFMSNLSYSFKAAIEIIFEMVSVLFEFRNVQNLF